jgi:DNA repair photolyase
MNEKRFDEFQERMKWIHWLEDEAVRRTGFREPIRAIEGREKMDALIARAQEIGVREAVHEFLSA